MESWWRGRDARVPPAPGAAVPRSLRGRRGAPAVVSDPTRTVRLAFVAPAQRAQAAREKRWALLGRAETALAVISLGVVVAVWLTLLLDAARPAPGRPALRAAPAAPAAPAATVPGATPSSEGVRGPTTISLAELPDATPANALRDKAPPASAAQAGRDPCASTVPFSALPSAPGDASADERAKAASGGLQPATGERIQAGRGDRARPATGHRAAQARPVHSDDDLPQNPYGS